MTAAVLLQSFAGETPPPARAAAPMTAAPASTPAHQPRFGADEAEALRDAAEALTPAAVALDERAGQRWRPLRGELADALADPHTPGPVRSELHATVAALDRLGL